MAPTSSAARLWWALFWLATILVGPAFAATTYYITTTGSDSNTCVQAQTRSTAKLTINSMQSCVTAGDTVVVEAGTYIYANTASAGIHYGVNTTVAGTSSAYIRYISETKWGAKLEIASAASFDETYIWLNEAKFVSIEDFHISGASTIGIANRGHGSRIKGNRVAGMRCQASGNGGAGISSGYSSAQTDLDTTEIVGNFVYNTGVCPSGPDPSGHHGIYPSYGSGVIANNIVCRVGAFGLHLYHNPRAWRILNNLVTSVSLNGNGRSGLIIGSDFVATPSTGPFQVSNNIILDGDGPAVADLTTFGISGITLDTNIFNGNTNGSYGFTPPDGCCTITNTITTRPTFTNYLTSCTGDYTLAAGSAAIDTGLTLADSQVATDFVGTTRPVNALFDLGPYEFGLGASGGNRRPPVFETSRPEITDANRQSGFQGPLITPRPPL